LRCRHLDSSVDVDPIRDHRPDDPAGQLARRLVRLDLGQVALEDGSRGALAEVRLEHGGQRDPTPGPQRPNAIGATVVSSRHRRPGR
jgi:hypothetical protein